MKLRSKRTRYNAVFKRITRLGLMLILVSAGLFVRGQDTEAHFDDPENLVRQLYDQLTFPAGETPDWNYVKKLFMKEAQVVMRVGKTKTATFSLEGWVQDFVNFIDQANIEATGFEEKIVKMKAMVFGDIAHILVLYTSYIPGKSKEPREGVDSFHLIRKDGKWQIVSILNEIPSPDRPKPGVLN